MCAVGLKYCTCCGAAQNLDSPNTGRIYKKKAFVDHDLNVWDSLTPNAGTCTAPCCPLQRLGMTTSSRTIAGQGNSPRPRNQAHPTTQPNHGRKRDGAPTTQQYGGACDIYYKLLFALFLPKYRATIPCATKPTCQLSHVAAATARQTSQDNPRAVGTEAKHKTTRPQHT